MKGSDRARRAQPGRETPNRQPGMATDAPGGQAGAAQAQADRDGKTVEQIVAEAVRKGYDVVGENIRQGRQAAQRMRTRTYEANEIPGELRSFANRLFQLGMELGTTWFELIGAILRDPQLREAFEGTRQPVPRPAGQAQPVSPPIVYTVRCSRPVEHSLRLHALSRPAHPTVAGLHSIEQGGHSIPAGRVTFDRHPEDGSLLVYINVPDEVPPGTYNGAVIDRDTHEAIGTLRVRIRA